MKEVMLFSRNPRSLSNSELEAIVVGAMFGIPRRRGETVFCLLLGTALLAAFPAHFLIVGPLAAFCFYTSAQRWSEIKAQEFMNEYFVRVAQQDVDASQLGEMVSAKHNARFSFRFDLFVSTLIAVALMVVFYLLL